MKLQRYDIWAFLDEDNDASWDYDPKDNGRWCDSDDVEKLESELERLIEENKWLRKEKEGSIQHEQNKQRQLHKMAEKFGLWDDIEKLDNSKGNS